MSLLVILKVIIKISWLTIFSCNQTHKIDKEAILFLSNLIIVDHLSCWSCCKTLLLIISVWSRSRQCIKYEFLNMLDDCSNYLVDCNVIKLQFRYIVLKVLLDTSLIISHKKKIEMFLRYRKRAFNSYCKFHMPFWACV